MSNETRINIQNIRSGLSTSDQREALKEQYRSNAEQQRRSQMSNEARVRDAQERVALNVKTYSEQALGKEMTYDQALKKASEIREKALKERGDFNQ